MTASRSTYDFTLDLDNPSSTHSVQLKMVPAGARVLDIGCHTGILGYYLRQEKKCHVVGIDVDGDALMEANERLHHAFLVNVETPGWSGHVKEHEQEGFDIVLFGDVLEHTRNPQIILEEARSLLKPGGRIIVSIPNVAHWRIRFGLAAGRFNYTESGILDRTHLRFFTRRTIRELLERAGYKIDEEDVAGYRLPHWLIRSFKTLLAVQFVCSAKVKRQ